MSNIVITEKFYINYSIRDEYDDDDNISKVRLGFATYYEDNVAFNKRKATIDKWADDPAKSDTIDNVPRTGYTFGDSVTHGGGRYTDTTVNWRIQDPLGFELEISSGNMATLIQYCTIDKGMILDECVWGWDKSNGSKVALIPVASPEYQEARKTTVRHFAEVINVKDVELGDMVEYKNGQMGIYFGKVNCGRITPGVGGSVKLGSIAFEQQHALFVDGNTILLMKTPKIVNASKGDKRYTQEEAAEFLNKCINDPEVHITSSTWWNANVNVFTYDKKPVVGLALEELSYDDFRTHLRGDWVSGQNQNIYLGSQSFIDTNYLIEKTDGSKWITLFLGHEVLGSGRRHQPTVDFLDGNANDVEIVMVPVANDDYLGTNTGIDVKYTVSPYSYHHQPTKLNTFSTTEVSKAYRIVQKVGDITVTLKKK